MAAAGPLIHHQLQHHVDLLPPALVGIPPPGYRAPVDVARLFGGHRVLGSYNGNTSHDDVCTVARLGEELRLADQVTRVWPLAEIADAIAAVRAGDVVRAVLDLS